MMDTIRTLHVAVAATLAFQCGAGFASDSCADRIADRAVPTFPTSTGAARALSQGDCTVTVTFVLNKDGKPKLVKSEPDHLRCKVFERSAQRAISASNFFKGMLDRLCTQRVTFALDKD